MPRLPEGSRALRERVVSSGVRVGPAIAHVASGLGLARRSLRGWVRQGEAEDAGQRRDRLTGDERERLQARERENRELRQANAIVKSASALFARSFGGTARG